MTGGVGAGIAIAGALIGGFVKASFPKQAALLIGIYAMALGLGSTIAAAATGPLSAIFASWRLGAGIWTLPGLMAMAAWLHVARAEAHPKGSPSAKSPALLAPLPFKNPTAWATAAYLSLTNILFFGLLSWLAPMYRELGASETKAGLILASFAGAFMLANPLPGLFSRNDDRRAMIGAFALAALIGMIALAIAPGGSAFLIVPLIAIGIGGSFTLGMTLPLDNAKSADDANAWNAFTMSIGYAVGALGPLLVGIMRDVTGGFQAPMWFLATVGLLMLSLAPILQPHHHRVSKTIAQKPQKMASRRSV
jgi:CP family cyanate transporter-like MFS transporter